MEDDFWHVVGLCSIPYHLQVIGIGDSVGNICDKCKGGVLGLMLGVRRKIDFVIVGFPKCATTSLHRTLSQVNSIAMPDHEVQIKDYVKGNVVCENDRKIFGIKNPNLIYESHNLRALALANKNIKIIIGLRNPRDWIYSFFQYRKLEIRSRRQWLGKYIEKDPQMLEIDFNDVVFGNANLLGASIKNGVYVRYLTNILEIIDSSQVYVYLMEQMSSDPKFVYGGLFQFLGLGDFDYPFEKKANRNSNKYEDKEKYRDALNFVDKFYSKYDEELNVLLKETWGIDNRYW